MTKNRDPQAGNLGDQEKLEDSLMVARCVRCGHRTSSKVSLQTGLGCDCRKHRARSNEVADRLIDLANNVDIMPLKKLNTVAKALDQIEVDL